MRVHAEDLDGDESSLVRYEGAPFSGVAVESSGTGVVEVEYKEGERSGFMREWSPSGALVLDQEWWRGLLHGRSRRWGPSGRLAEDSQYCLGVCVRAAKFSEDGKQVSDYLLANGDPLFALLQVMRQGLGKQAPPTIACDDVPLDE